MSNFHLSIYTVFLPTSALNIIVLIIRNWRVQLGAYNLTDDSEEEWTERTIKEITIHPQFEKKSKAAYHDVAILILESAVQFDDTIRPVCLPEESNIEVNHMAGAAASVSGWGKTNDFSSASETLKTAHISVYNQRLFQN